MNNKTFLYTFFLALLGVFAYGQQPYDKETLQKQSTQLRQEISELNKALSVSKNESKASIVYIANLNKKINVRTELINTTKKESRVLEDEIYLSQLEINKLRRELKELRTNYADVLIKSYKNKSIQNKILFILSSDNISQAFRRIKYLQKYSEYQDMKVAEINDKQQQILKTVEVREKAKTDKLNVLAQQQTQIGQLGIERKEKEVVVEQYIKQQGDIVAKIKQKQGERQTLERQVQAIIAEEIRIVKAREAEEKRKAAEAEIARRKTIEEERAKKALEAKLAADKLAAEKAAIAKQTAEKAIAAAEIAKREANDRTAAERAVVATKAAEKAAAERSAAEKLAVRKTSEANAAEEKAEEKRKSIGITSQPTVTASETLSRSFEANRKSLPWPVSGTIVSSFGRTPHPVVPNIEVDHKGVEIAASAGSLAKAVFGGTISKILVIPGGGKAVLINHGDYFTLYANLSTVIVSVGDKVKTGQSLGKIYTDDTNTTLLGFQVWKGTTPQNPSNWISGM